MPPRAPETFHGLAAFIRAGVQYASARCASAFDRADGEEMLPDAGTAPDAIARQKQSQIYKATGQVVSSLIDQTDPK